ncbi:hypothetical protein EJ06DRAFT_530975 [Trichodelitschia bisporula]|uniref:RanBP2-type domain-containing protein n=1 Tax=Trichodelitschia bisporula TaxID=703511 RepID=A0A6G1HTV1_9PEZI|nr:hypothetical protein EJ06DRAFT_530975 [Trichodelitschia bisporula]
MQHQMHPLPAWRCSSCYEVHYGQQDRCTLCGMPRSLTAPQDCHRPPDDCIDPILLSGHGDGHGPTTFPFTRQMNRPPSSSANLPAAALSEHQPPHETPPRRLPIRMMETPPITPQRPVNPPLQTPPGVHHELPAQIRYSAGYGPPVCTPGYGNSGSGTGPARHLPGKITAPACPISWPSLGRPIRDRLRKMRFERKKLMRRLAEQEQWAKERVTTQKSLGAWDGAWQEMLNALKQEDDKPVSEPSRKDEG